MSAAAAGALAVLGGASALRAWQPVVQALLARRAWRAPAPVVVRAQLVDVGLAARPDDLWTGWLGAVAAASALGLVVGGPALALVVVVAVVLATALALACFRGRAARQVDAALPDLLDGVARSLRSGATLAQALAEAATAPGPLAVELGVVVADVGAGRSLVGAIDAWAARTPAPGVRLVAAAMALSAERGGAAARAIDGVAATLRGNLAVAGELRAQSAQARLSAAVIALAPVAFGMLAMGVEPRAAKFLLRTGPGLACLAGGLALDAVAAWWMQRITAAAR